MKCVVAASLLLVSAAGMEYMLTEEYTGSDCGASTKKEDSLEILDQCEKTEEDGKTYYEKKSCTADKYKKSFYSTKDCTGATVAATPDGSKNLTKEEPKSCANSKKRTCGTAVKADIMVLHYALYNDSGCATKLDGYPKKHAYNYCQKKSSGSKKQVVADGKVVTNTYTTADCTGDFTPNNVSNQATIGSCFTRSYMPNGQYQMITLPGTKSSSSTASTASRSSSIAGILARALGLIYAVMVQSV